jgi:hypothetical protein
MPLNTGMSSNAVMPLNTGMSSNAVMPLNTGMSSNAVMPLNTGMSSNAIMPLNTGMPLNMGRPPSATGRPPNTIVHQVPQRSSQVNLSSVAVVKNPSNIAITHASIQAHQGAPSGAKRDSLVAITSASLVAKPNQANFQGVSVQKREREVTKKIDGQEYTIIMKEYYLQFFKIQLEKINFDERSQELPPYRPSFSETAIYGCCQAYSCTFTRVDRYMKDSDSMRKARALGANLIKDKVTKPNTVNPCCAVIKECFLYGGLIALLVLFIIACVDLVRDVTDEDKNKKQILISFSIASLVFSFFGLCFYVVDVFIYLRYKGCRLLKYLCSGCPDQNSPSEGGCCGTLDDDSPACCPNACKGKCCSSVVAVMDAMRLFVMETIFYPSLILSIFEFIVKFDENDYKFHMISGFEWFKIFFTFICSLLLNYFIRALFFASTLYSLYKARPPKNKRTGMCFQIAFVAYGCGQMVIQMLMIVMIGLRFQKDYSAGQSEAIDKSFLLWYMVVWAYLNPIIGFFMFFFIHHFWTFNFPVKLMYDILKQFQFRGQYFNKNEIDTFNRMFRYINMEELKKNIEKYDKTNFGKKFAYPFISPLHIIVSMVYCLFMCGFFISFVLSPPSTAPPTRPPTTFPITFPTASPSPPPFMEIHETIFFLMTLVMTLGVNMYVFSVFLLWTMIIIGFILITILICFTCMCCADSENRARNARYN